MIYFNSVTCYQSLGKISCFGQYNTSENWTNTNGIFLIDFYIKITQISMFTIGLIKNQTICEKNYILCWIVPKKIKVLLAFSWFPTYTDSLLLPGFPLLPARLKLKLRLNFPRETVPSLTSDMGKKTVSVLAHWFFLPQRANSGYILSISPLRYSRSKPCAEAQISVPRHVLSTWPEWMKVTSPAVQNKL